MMSRTLTNLYIFSDTYEGFFRAYACLNVNISDNPNCKLVIYQLQDKFPEHVNSRGNLWVGKRVAYEILLKRGGTGQGGAIPT